MDLAVTSETFVTPDRSWLDSTFAIDAPVTRTLDISNSVKATHYPNGFFKSGIVIAKITASGLYAPYVNDASDGRQTPIGIIFDGGRVRYDRVGDLKSTRTTCSVILKGIPIMVKLSKLPGLLLDDDSTAYAVTSGDLSTLGFIDVEAL